MISQTNSSAIRSMHASNLGEPRDTKQVKATKISAQGDTSKVERIKEALDAGEYKIDLEALSQKIADELL